MGNTYYYKIKASKAGCPDTALSDYADGLSPTTPHTSFPYLLATGQGECDVSVMCDYIYVSYNEWSSGSFVRSINNGHDWEANQTNITFNDTGERDTAVDSYGDYVYLTFHDDGNGLRIFRNGNHGAAGNWFSDIVYAQSACRSFK